MSDHTQCRGTPTACLRARSAGAATAEMVWRKKQCNAYRGALSVKVSCSTSALVESPSVENMPDCQQEPTADSGSRGVCSLVGEWGQSERKANKKPLSSDGENGGGSGQSLVENFAGSFGSISRRIKDRRIWGEVLQPLPHCLSLFHVWLGL